MRGFVLNTVRVRDEDLIVRILGEREVYTLYRFYGARHSYINVGNLIDFVIEESPKTTIKRLRNVVQLPFKFMFDLDKMLHYKIFVSLLNKHLQDVSKIDPFYFNWLKDITDVLHERDPKRLFIESYVKMIEKEGRLHDDFVCFLCESKVNEKVALARAFLPAHEKCIMSEGFEKEKISLLFKEKKSLLLDDNEIERLWRILNLGF
ncbi:recombination protein RecO [Caminibacter pacificus]|uniref:RecO-like protein n=1 Tax=Caminibacter pacificus TaxID=1424653 RepID=A0AAJ4RD91_9BACT|nr:recombination protein RecO [Caminibacter pacificus]QCI27579.1 recombination protein RecO [Caminibacter pacificus]ROR40242.1 RecO-like protein [Caminibacter pacificus]